MYYGVDIDITASQFSHFPHPCHGTLRLGYANPDKTVIVFIKLPFPPVKRRSPAKPHTQWPLGLGFHWLISTGWR